MRRCDKKVLKDYHKTIVLFLYLIIRIDNRRAMLAPTISRIIQQFKGYVTKQTDTSIWQYKFYGHIMEKHQYINKNPVKWAETNIYQNMF